MFQLTSSEHRPQIFLDCEQGSIFHEVAKKRLTRSLHPPLLEAWSEASLEKALRCLDPRLVLGEARSPDQEGRSYVDLDRWNDHDSHERLYRHPNVVGNNSQMQFLGSYSKNSSWMQHNLWMIRVACCGRFPHISCAMRRDLRFCPRRANRIA